MAILDGVGIVSAGKEAQAKALTRAKQAQSNKKIAAEYKVDPYDKLLRDIDRNFQRIGAQESTGGVKETGRGMGDRFDPTKDFQVQRPGYFSPDGGGAFDARNNVEVASSDIQSLSVPGSDAFNQEIKQYEQKVRNTPPFGSIDKFGTDETGDLTNEGQKRLEDSYKIYRDFNYERNPIKYQQGVDFSKKEGKQSIGEKVASFAGGVFNAITGTQPASAQTKSNLDKTKEIGEGLFTGGVSPDAYTVEQRPQYKINREENRPLVSKNLDAAKSTSEDTSFSSYRMGGGAAGEEQSNVTTPKGVAKIASRKGKGKGKDKRVKVSKVGGRAAAVKRAKKAKKQSPKGKGKGRQTVASLPSDYKKTEAEEFRKAAIYQRAKKNPNVKTGVDDKGQVKVTARQKTRKQAKARTAKANRARTRQNAKARAQASAYNRQLKNVKPKSAKQRAQDAAKARRAAGPNRTMSAGQQTRSQAGPSARTAAGNRARVKSNARKRAQSAARARRACDIFLKYDISPLTNMNLIRDDLAEVAYFVKEIQK